MHLKQLEIFVNVVKYRSFSRAAETLYMSQPTVSAHISALEDAMGTKLIARSTKEVLPTKAGKILYQYALEILNLTDLARIEVKSYSTQIKGELEIAASTVPSQYLLPRALFTLCEKYPEVMFSIKQYDSVEVVQKIVDMEAELGITGAIYENSGCVFEHLASDRMVIITPGTEKYRAMKGVITAQDILSAPFVGREQGSGTRKEAESFLRAIGVEPDGLKCPVRLQSTESVVQAVKNDIGISVVSRLACEDVEASGGVLVFDYPGSDLDRSFYLIYRKNWPLSPAAEAVAKELKAFFGRK